jgi:alpha-mannosidase
MIVMDTPCPAANLNRGPACRISHDKEVNPMDDRIIRMKLDAIRRSALTGRWPIGPWQARTADFIAVGEYRFDGDWAEITGEATWPAGKTAFIRAAAETPVGVPAAGLFIQFDAEGLEGLLSVDGRPYAGIDANHLRVAVPHAGRLELAAEFVSLLASLHRAELRRERGRLREVAFVQVDREIEAAYYDFWFTWEASQFTKDVRRKQLLQASLEAALLVVDLTAPADAYRSQVLAARALLGERIAAIAPDPEAGRIYLTGHSHIDTAWLWTLRETVRKCARTFATACRMMERFPNYHFTCSQPQLYAYTKTHFPALYEEIKKWVATGRWECTGGPWVEMDCNVPSGEALIRQMMHGLRFFREEFGARPHSLWLPDVFGYPASLPQILAGCGLRDFYTNKLHWQARNLFPVNLFWWEGIDGSRVLAHIPKLRNYYNGWPNPEQFSIAWDNFEQKAIYDEVMLPFGFGDGGGGPTEEMLEFTARAGAFPGLPATRQGGGEAYFDDVRKTLGQGSEVRSQEPGVSPQSPCHPVTLSPSLPVWAGELYLETHRGTYTTHGEIKRANRKNELALREAEIAGFMAEAAGVPVDLKPLDAAWENLLLLQFHDILPGSSIGEVYHEAAADHARTAETARAVRDAAWGGIARRVTAPGEIVAFNSLSWPRYDIATVTLPEGALPVQMGCDCAPEIELVADDGRATPAQVVRQADGQVELAFAAGGLPALGYARFTVRQAAAAAESSLRISPRLIENRFFRIELDADGCLTRLLDQRAAREVIPAGQRANELQLFQDGPEREAAWNIHATFEKRTYDWDLGTTVEVSEAGPVRAALRITRRYRNSTLVQEVRVYDQTPRIDFVTQADWQARQVLLKVAFPVAVRAPRATFEIQFGAVERPTHRNTSWEQEKFEVCAHRWADLSETGYGVSLLNDCKYGYDVRDNVLRLTLLRGPEAPDPDADRGRHEFTYALFPHAGGWGEGETARRGWELNAPVACVAGDDGRTTNDEGRTTAQPVSFFQVAGPAILETLKPAADGDGWIVRLYEPNGGRGPVTLRSARPWQQVTRCNLVEEGDAELAAAGQTVTFAMQPFEIIALRVRFGGR